MQRTFPDDTPIHVIRWCIAALAEVERQSRPRVRGWRPRLVWSCNFGDDDEMQGLCFLETSRQRSDARRVPGRSAPTRGSREG